MHDVKPEVYLIHKTVLQREGMEYYLNDVGGLGWYDRTVRDGTLHDLDLLAEFEGRLCYQSWEPGINLNVSKVREDSAEYLANIIDSEHFNVMQHGVMGFVFHNVSRIFTHEVVRHAAGVAKSQESFRYVRRDEYGFWIPDGIFSEEEEAEIRAHVEAGEALARRLAEAHGLNDPKVPFHRKKRVNSAIRRIHAAGNATDIGYSMNLQAARHIIRMRTDVAAEDEVRLVFDKVAEIIKEHAPLCLQDMRRHESGAWL